MVRFFILFLVSIFFIGCSSEDKTFEFQFRELPLKKIKSIDISNIDNFDCDYFAVDKKENIFLLNSRYVRIVKLDSNGKFLQEMTIQGEGPGEIKDFPHITTTNQNLWVTSYRKICIYNPDTLELIKNIKLDKGAHSITPLTEQSWISTKEFPDNNDWSTELWNQKINEEPLKIFTIEKGSRMEVAYSGGTVSFFPGTPITHELVFKKSGSNIVCANSIEYKLYLKDQMGRILKVVEIPHINPDFTDEAKQNVIDEFVTQYRKGLPKAIKKGCKEALPDKLSAIASIRNLPQNRLLVRSVIGYKQYRDDIFDKDLNYLYSLKNILLPKADSIKTVNNKIFIFIKEDNKERIEVYTLDE